MSAPCVSFTRPVERVYPESTPLVGVPYHATNCTVVGNSESTNRSLPATHKYSTTGHSRLVSQQARTREQENNRGGTARRL